MAMADVPELQKKNWPSINWRSLSTQLILSLIIMLVVESVAVYVVFLVPLGPEVGPIPTLTSVQNEEYSVDVFYPRNTIIPLGRDADINIRVCIRERAANVSARVSDFTLNLTAPAGSRLQQNGGFSLEGINPHVWTTSLSIRYSGNIETFNETLVVHMVYKFSSQNSTIIRELNAPLFVNIVMQDFPEWVYLVFVIGGVFVSYLTSGVTITSIVSVAQVDKKTAAKILVWLGFGTIVGILGFSQFRKQIILTGEPVLNFALAFGFGFASEKILSLPAPKPNQTPPPSAH
jgi:hypothetical protein